MTKEEAIEFGNMWLEVNEDCKDSNTYEFFKIALERLKKEPCEDVVKKDCGNCAYYDNGANDEACNGCFEDEEHLNFKPKVQYCEDYISRQAVLNGLASIAKVKARSDAQKSLMGRSMFFVEQLSPVIPQPYEDCISRQAVLNQAVDYGSNTYLIPVNSVKTLPSVIPQPKIGHWIYDEKSRVYRCSRCNRFPWRVKVEKQDEIFTDLTRTNAYKYCPNCGIKMIKIKESEK